MSVNKIKEDKYTYYNPVNKNEEDICNVTYHMVRLMFGGQLGLIRKQMLELKTLELEIQEEIKAIELLHKEEKI